MYAAATTYVSVLTPQSRGAIAVVRVAGPAAESAVDQHFKAANGKPIGCQPIGRIAFGHWGGSSGEEVVLCRTGESVVEIHCHGGIAAPAAIVEALEKADCVSVAWTDFLAIEESDAIALSARQALADARTTRAASILLDQYRGALRTAFDEIELLSKSADAGDRTRAREQAELLLARSSTGMHLTVPWRVAIAGRPNAGKSSLINALLGYDRAIVFDQPGTTRDVVTALTAFDGWSIELADMAGLRTTSDEVEAAGVAKAEAVCAAADLVVLVIDITSYDAQDEQSLLADYPDALVVYNKCDLLPATEFPTSNLATSAITQWGLPQLQQAIVARLVSVPIDQGDAVPFTAEHLARLHALQASPSRCG